MVKGKSSIGSTHDDTVSIIYMFLFLAVRHAGMSGIDR